jgi:hypothetical protein
VLPIGKRIQRLFSSRARRVPPDTEPVFGLAPAPGGFWAVTPRGIYRWAAGTADRRPFPKLRVAHGIAAAKSGPGLLVVETDANAALSLSGYTPLIFAVEGTAEDGR